MQAWATAGAPPRELHLSLSWAPPENTPSRPHEDSPDRARVGLGPCSLEHPCPFLHVAFPPPVLPPGSLWRRQSGSC